MVAPVAADSASAACGMELATPAGMELIEAEEEEENEDEDEDEGDDAGGR